MTPDNRQDKSKVRYERILETAQDIFARKGYRDTAMDEIASAAETSKGGLYFHFPNKQTIFTALLNQMAALLLSRVEQAMSNESDLTKKGDAALQTVLHTFGSHPRLTRLFLIEAPGAGHEFNAKLLEMHASFTTLIQSYLKEAQAAELIDPDLDTHVASIAWFGAINEVVMRQIMTENAGQPNSLEDIYPTLRTILRRGLGMRVI